MTTCKQQRSLSQRHAETAERHDVGFPLFSGRCSGAGLRTMLFKRSQHCNAWTQIHGVGIEKVKQKRCESEPKSHRRSTSLHPLPLQIARIEGLHHPFHLAFRKATVKNIFTSFQVGRLTYSTMSDMGAHSYKRRSLPVGLLLSAGYP